MYVSAEFSHLDVVSESLSLWGLAMFSPALASLIMVAPKVPAEIRYKLLLATMVLLEFLSALEFIGLGVSLTDLWQANLLLLGRDSWSLSYLCFFGNLMAFIWIPLAVLAGYLIHRDSRQISPAKQPASGP
jgi:hypothetical protein